MLVATVTAPSLPAWDTISLSRSTFSGRAFSTCHHHQHDDSPAQPPPPSLGSWQVVGGTWVVMLSSARASAMSSDVSTDVVPIRMGCPVRCARLASRSMARSLPSFVLQPQAGRQAKRSVPRVDLPAGLLASFPSYLKMASGLSLRALGRAVGMGTTGRL